MMGIASLNPSYELQIDLRIDVGRARNREVGGAQRAGPALAQILEIGLARLDPIGELGHAGVRAGDLRGVA